MTHQQQVALARLGNIKAGPRQIRVAIDPSMANRSGNYGEYSGRNSTITLEASLEWGHACEVLLHELFHVCWARSIVDQTLDAYLFQSPDIDLLPKRRGDLEETIVDSLSTYLAQILRENPDLLVLLSGNWSQYRSHING